MVGRSAGFHHKELESKRLAKCIDATKTPWGGNPDQAKAVGDIFAWMKAPSCQKASAVSLFQSIVRFVEHHVPAEFISVDNESTRIEATVYETFIPLHVAIRVRSADSSPSSEVEFSNLCGRDIVCFHQFFTRATKFLEEAAVTSRVRGTSQLQFLDFDSEDEEQEWVDSAKADDVEATLEPLIANLSSPRAGEREDAVSMLARIATDCPGCRRSLNVVLARQPVISALQRLLRPESTTKETACPEATRYLVLVLIVRLTEVNYMKVEVAQELHSMLAELDLCHCSAPVQAELSTALNGVLRIAARQD